MILDALLSLLGGLLSAVGALLPDYSRPVWMDWVDWLIDPSPGGGTVAEAWGASAGPMDQWLPLSESLQALDWVLSYWLPAVVAFIVARFVWRSIPVVGGS